MINLNDILFYSVNDPVKIEYWDGGKQLTQQEITNNVTLILKNSEEIYRMKKDNRMALFCEYQDNIFLIASSFAFDDDKPMNIIKFSKITEAEAQILINNTELILQMKDFINSDAGIFS